MTTRKKADVVTAAPNVPLAHTWCEDTPYPVLVTDPDHPYAEPVNGVVDCTACGCATRVYLYRDLFNRVERMTVEHQPACRWLRRLCASLMNRDPHA